MFFYYFWWRVTNVEIAKQYLSSGADKVLINSSIYENDILINDS